MAPLCAKATAAYLLLSDPTAVAATAQTGVRVASENGSISFPLIPHHVQRRRLGLSSEELEFELELEDDDRGRGRRRTSAGPQNEVMSGLYMGYGTHYVDLYCGTPPQRQTVIVDTGSSQTAFPCSDCKDCGADKYHTGPLFDESKSSTFLAYGCDDCTQRSTCNSKTHRCEMEQSYSEGSSWTAYEALDTCYMGGYHNTAIISDNGNRDDADPGHALAFGFDARIQCQTEVTGLFKTQLADGIMGMCDAKLAFWHQMFRAHKIREKQFSLCYTRPPHALREGSEAGAITLGGTDERLHNLSPMVYTTIVGTSSEIGVGDGKSGFYDIHVREMYLREGSAGELAQPNSKKATVIKLAGAGAINDEGGVIVDSGTTDTYFSNVIKKQLYKHWEELSGTSWGHDKKKLTPEEVSKLPTLLIQFAGDEEMNKAVADKHSNGDSNKISGLAGDLDKNYPYDVVIAIPASHYMEVMADGSVTNRIYATEDDGSVLGANSMVGHDVMFDAQNMRLGWAESSCDYSGLVKENGYISAMTEVYESEEEIEEEDQEEEEQEEEKEEYDEENAEEEIEEDNENIEEFIEEGGTVEHFTKSKHNNSKNIEIPIDDLIDNPAFAGIGFAIFFLGGIFCVFRYCGPASKKRRRRKRNHKQHEIEMNENMNSNGGNRGYTDKFEDEEDSSGSSGSEYSDNDGMYDDYDDSEEFSGRKEV